MPRALEPGRRLPVVLEFDRESPADSRPTIFIAAHNARVGQKLLEELDAVYAEKDLRKQNELVLSLLRPFVVDWQNMRDPATKELIPFDPKNLDLIVDGEELWELLAAIRHNGRVSPDDRKKSESPA